ncbi:MAG: amino acid adenylation domain-containing protein, partial [Opitutales bacterium]|nr:amino acid adenylation domain-containing protein [Opitutales bacterium]
HLLALSAHHIICDGWSVFLLAEELGVIYSALKKNRSPQLPPADSFSAYARHQVEKLPSRKRFASAEAYWLQQFSDPVTELEAPYSKPRPSVRNYTAGQVYNTLPFETVSKIRELAAASRGTVFTVLFSAFAALLHRLSGQTDLVIGVPIASQVMGGHERLVGHCANLLPMRSRLTSGLSFNALLNQTRTTVFEGFDAWEYPFGELLRRLKLRSSGNRVPLANVTFNLSRMPETVHFDGLNVVPEGFPKNYLNFDISFNATEDADGIAFNCRYSKELFDKEDIERFLSQYIRFIEQSLDSPTQAINTAPLLSSDEREEMLFRWNNSTREISGTQTIHGLFVEQAQRTPQKTALQFHDETLTYAELDAASSDFALRLQEQGVLPGDRVGLCLSRSPKMLVCLLGILKAGAAYLPLDPASPKARIAFVLKDARPKLIVSEAEFLPTFPEDTCSILCIDRSQPDIPIGSSNTLKKTATKESEGSRTAYIIYTSGSTGTPKGVAISNASVVNFLRSMEAEPGLTHEDTLLAVTTLSFDIAVLELYLPLISGGRVVIASRDESMDALALSRLIEVNKITVMQATPATWRMLIASGWKGSPQLRILCGGESLSRSLAESLLERCKELWNLYGPTETTVWSSVSRITSGLSVIGIGRPIANTQLHILDPNGELLPVGLSGELCIGGSGLSSGYVNRPELTAEKFVYNPLIESEDSRLYRTGDLAKRMPDGNIQVIGRMDSQVKIRGHRIELGEIETALQAHPEIGDAVVIVHSASNDEPQLLAYTVPRLGGALPIDLKSHLKACLPDYMVPALYRVLESMPLTPNGKIDRRALPDPGSDPIPVAISCTPARNPTEAILVEIWQEVLQLSNIGVDNNFFDLGGHSLMATRIISRIRRRFDVELPFRTLFDDPTIARLAVFIDAELAEEATYRSDNAKLRQSDQKKTLKL